MKEKVAELIKGKKTDYEKIYAIFQFVAKKIRYMGITTEKVAPGNEPHDVDITFNNRYGVCRDKAALLVAMLQIAGFKSYPVLFYNGTKKDPEVPNNYFNHAIVSVLQPDGKYLLMDPTDETTSELLPTYLCDKSYLPATPKGETLMTSAVNPASKNMLKVKSVGKIAEDGKVELTTDMQFSGINDNVYRGAFSRWKKERISQFIAGRLKSVVAGAELKSLKITPANLRDMSKPLRIKLSFTANNYLVKGTDNTVLSPPWLGSYFGVVNFLLRGSAGLNKRKFPLKLYSTCGVKESFKLELPQDYPVAAMPKYKGVDTSTLAWDRDMKVTGRTVSGSSEFLIKAMEFSPKQYIELKDLLKKIEFEKRKLLIMQDPPLTDYPGAEAVILDEKSEITIKSESEWVLRKYMKKKILTYAGVKNNSELKINYNPAWHKVKIIKAQTTSSDGKVKKLNKKELNIMDASWVASAPRYPAEKVMVASLPNVRTGSIIEYEIEHHFTKQPFFSTIAVFQRDIPIEKKTFSIINSGILKQLRISCDKLSPNNANSKDKMWSVENVGPVKSEIAPPPIWSFGKSLMVTNSSWGGYAKQLSRFFEKSITGNEKAKELANELVKECNISRVSRLFGNDDRYQAIIKIRDWVAKNIRDAGPGLNDLPLSAISRADITLKDRYGNNADRAILLAAMLRSVGFDAQIVPVSSYYNKPVEIWGRIWNYPLPIFNTVLCEVKVDKQKFYLNDTNQYAQLGTTAHEYKMGLDLANDRLTTVSFSNACLGSDSCKSTFKVFYDIDIDTDGTAKITKKVTSFGTYYEAKKKLYAEITPENLKRRYQNLASAISQSALPLSPLSPDFKSYPGTETFSIKVPNFAVKEGKYMYFKLPGMDFLKGFIRVDGESRINPYLIDSKFSHNASFSVSIPQTYSYVEKPASNIDISAPGIDVKINSIVVKNKHYGFYRKSDHKGGRFLNLSVYCNKEPAWIKSYQYPLLAALNAKLSNPALSLIILKTKAEK